MLSVALQTGKAAAVMYGRSRVVAIFRALFCNSRHARVGVLGSVVVNRVNVCLRFRPRYGPGSDVPVLPCLGVVELVDGFLQFRTN